MTSEKEPQTEAERREKELMEKERLEKWLSELPGITPPTREMGKVVFDPIEIPGEPLSQTIIKARRC